MTRILSIILLILLLSIGRGRGAKTFLTFYLSIILIASYVILMSMGINAIILAIIICLIATVITLFILNGYNKKTISSFISIAIVLLIITIMIMIVGYNANIQGFTMEDLDSIGAFSYDINYSMTDVIIGMYLICIIGTVIDTSISISSSMNEVYENNKKINSKELFLSGMNIGSDILSTTINTLYFALMSSFIGFFMWYRGFELEYIINSKSFVQKIIELLLSFIASILIIPITSYISSKILLTKKLDKQQII